MSAPSTQQQSVPQQQLTDAQTLEQSLEKTRLRVAELERDKRESELLNGITFSHDGMEAANLAALWRLASMYSRSDIVPEQFRGKPENCLIALQMAQRCRIDPFAFMQASYVVHGKPGIEAKLAIAMLNSSGQIAGRMRYEFTGEGQDEVCTAIVKDKSGEELRMPISWRMVEANGWHLEKKGQASKWVTMRQQMFRYRSAMFLIRAHYPEVTMGLSTTDELEDMTPSPAPAGPPVGKGIRLGRNGNGAHKEQPHEESRDGSHGPQSGDASQAPEASGTADVPATGGAGDAPGQDQEVAEDQMGLQDEFDDILDKVSKCEQRKDVNDILSQGLAKATRFGGKRVDQLNKAASNRLAQLDARPAVAGKVGGKKSYDV